MKNTNPCETCPYCWADEWDSFPYCHYEGPHQWSPCEADDEAERIRLEREEEEDFRRQIMEEEMDIDELAEKIDETFHDFDPYEYKDSEGSVEKARELLEKDPLKVIHELLTIIDELC